MNRMENPLAGVKSEKFRQVGKPLIRTDSPTKVYGTAVYAGDLTMPGMLYAAVLHSERASALLRRVDTTRAKELPGVHCVLTAEDLPASQGVMTDMPGQTGGMTKNTKQPILAKDRVRFCGEPIALVAAESVAIAEQAIGLIDVDYQDIDGVYDPFDALAPGAPIVYGDDNVVASYKIRKGDIEKGFAEADVIVENTFTTQYQEQAFLEPEAALAWVDELEVLNIRSSTQVVEHYRAVADAIGSPGPPGATASGAGSSNVSQASTRLESTSESSVRK
jgi:CO/xanthine dehydrogenase Mo-binding subunit